MKAAQLAQCPPDGVQRWTRDGRAATLDGVIATLTVGGRELIRLHLELRAAPPAGGEREHPPPVIQANGGGVFERGCEQPGETATLRFGFGAGHR